MTIAGNNFTPADGGTVSVVQNGVVLKTTTTSGGTFTVTLPVTDLFSDEDLEVDVSGVNEAAVSVHISVIQ